MAMKIFTRSVSVWNGERYVTESAVSFDYEGPLARAKGGGKAPPAPDPAVQTNAESAANRYDVNSPFGTQTWDQGAREVIGYDSKGAPQYGQRYTQNIELNPSEQRQYDLHNQIAEQLLTGNEQNIQNLTNDPFQYDKSAYGGAPYSTDRSGYSSGRFNYDQATPEAAKASYQRQVDLLTPEFKNQDNAFEQKLANQGIPMGSDAYNEALRQHENNKNFALTQAAQSAEQFGTGLALSQRQQQQGEAGEQASQGLTQRQQRLTEAQQLGSMGLSERQQRYNEIAAALGGEQLNPVNQGGGGGNAPLDVAGAYGAYNQAQLAKYNSQQASSNGLMGGLFGLGSAALSNPNIFSDERLKEDIEPVGELPSGEGVYEYHYKWDEPDSPKHVGVMAQEVERTQPDAVTLDPSGYKKVNYRKLIARVLAEAA